MEILNQHIEIVTMYMELDTIIHCMPTHLPCLATYQGHYILKIYWHMLYSWQVIYALGRSLYIGIPGMWEGPHALLHIKICFTMLTGVTICWKYIDTNWQDSYMLKISLHIYYVGKLKYVGQIPVN